MKYTVMNQETGKLCCAANHQADLCSDCRASVDEQVVPPPPNLRAALRDKSTPTPTPLCAVEPPDASTLRSASTRKREWVPSPAPDVLRVAVAGGPA